MKNNIIIATIIALLGFSAVIGFTKAGRADASGLMASATPPRPTPAPTATPYCPVGDPRCNATPMPTPTPYCPVGDPRCPGYIPPTPTPAPTPQPTPTPEPTPTPITTCGPFVVPNNQLGVLMDQLSTQACNSYQSTRSVDGQTWTVFGIVTN